MNINHLSVSQSFVGFLKAQVSSVSYVYCCDFFVIPIRRKKKKAKTNPPVPSEINILYFLYNHVDWHCFEQG